MKVLVLGGGSSPEREVSLRSARSVLNALIQAGYAAEEGDPANGYNFLDTVNRDTIVFPVLHGAGGEDGALQKELENRNLPFLGTRSRASAICFDKAKTRRVLNRAGVPIASGDTVTRETYSGHQLNRKPHVLKVTTGGSSIGTYIVRHPADVDSKKVDEVFALGAEAVIEELVEGIEITVPVLDTQALPVIEIRPPESGFSACSSGDGQADGSRSSDTISSH